MTSKTRATSGGRAVDAPAATPAPERPPKSGGGARRRRRHPWSPALAERLCARLAEGDTIQRLCQRHDMPAWATVQRWLATRPAFRDAWNAARAAHAELLIDEALEIARDPAEEDAQRRKALLGELHWQYGVRYAGGHRIDKSVPESGAREEDAARLAAHLAAWDRVAQSQAARLAATSAQTVAPTDSGAATAGPDRKPAAPAKETGDGA